jgi:hypothetical protein
MGSPKITHFEIIHLLPKTKTIKKMIAPLATRAALNTDFRFLLKKAAILNLNQHYFYRKAHQVKCFFTPIISKNTFSAG